MLSTLSVFKESRKAAANLRDKPALAGTGLAELAINYKRCQFLASTRLPRQFRVVRPELLTQTAELQDNVQAKETPGNS